MAAFLYFVNPAETKLLPRCPLVLLTGYKCPGCGTLRAAHALLHMRFAEAWSFSPAFIIGAPLLAVIFAFPRIQLAVPGLGWIVFFAAIAWGVVRNILGL